MDIFLIDFENVKSEGLNGILNLAKTDLVCVFWSLKEDKLKIETAEQLMRCQVPVHFYKADVGGKNALDHQLSSYLGYLIGQGTEANYYIVSNDKGYRFLADFWKRMKVDAPIELAPSIKAVKVRQQQMQQRQQMFNEPRIERIAQKADPMLLPVKENVSLPQDFTETNEIPAETVVDIPAEISGEETETNLLVSAEENAPAEANTPAEPEKKTSRKRRRGNRKKRKPNTDHTAETNAADNNIEETPAEPEVLLPEPAEEEPQEIPAAETLPAAHGSELPETDIETAAPADSVPEEIPVETTPEVAAEASEDSEETKEQPKKRSRSSRNRRSRNRKKNNEAKAEVPTETISPETPAEETSPVEVPTEDVILTEVPSEETPMEEPPVEEAPAEETIPAEAPIEETPIEEPPVEEVPSEDTIPAEAPSEEAPAEALPVEKPAAVKKSISMEDLLAVIPDCGEKPWLEGLLTDINHSRNKRELYNKVIRRVKPDKGRDIYHKIKNIMP